MGTYVTAYLTHDLPSFDDAAAALSRLDLTLPECRAVDAYWRSEQPDARDHAGWALAERQEWGPTYHGPGALSLTITPACARVHAGGRWRGLLTIEPLRRVHVAALRAIGRAFGSRTLAICHDDREDALEVFLNGGSHADCIATLRSALGPPQPSIDLVPIEIVAQAINGVPQVWYLDDLTQPCPPPARAEAPLAPERDAPGVDEAQYHVDVVAGPDRRYVRGPSLHGVTSEHAPSGSLFRVRDDELGTVPDEDAWISAPMCLADALRLGLMIVRPRVPLPVHPAWDSAPWHVLGFSLGRRPERLFGFLPWPGLRWTSQSVGPDGRPAVGTDT